MRKRFRRGISLLFALLFLPGISGCGKSEPKITVTSITPGSETAIEPAEFTGGWYGYWCVSDADGDWERLEGKYIDSCAEVRQVDKGIVIRLWDEDMPRDNYLAEFQFEKSEDRYRCSGGDFLDVAVVTEDIGLQLLNADGPALQITGRCVTPKDGAFYYTFFLRPWGDTWPDSGHRPSHYESWYLPEMEDSDSVPGSINVK